MNNDELLIAIKEMFDKKVEEVKIHSGILAENLRSDVKAVSEGHEILFKKIDDTKAELVQSINNIEKRLDNTDKNMATVKDYVIAVDAKLNEHEVILKRVK